MTSRLSARWLLGIAAVAFAARLVPILHGGGLDFGGRYDDGVYYAAADALTFGREPYRSFVLLHPPGLILFLTPFVMLGRLTSDPTGMAVGRVFFMLIGALNTVLVATLAARWDRRAGIAAGLIYALWLPAVYGEQATLLEPLGGMATLVALILLLKTNQRPTVRAELLAGVALGLGCTVKIWYVAPLATIAVWQLLSAGWRATLRLVAGAAVAMTVVLLPFFALAPRDMFDMVVRDQLTRPDPSDSTSRATRMVSIAGVRGLVIGHHTAAVVLTVLISAVIVICAAAIVRDGAARAVVAILIVNLVVLFASPSYYEHYSALTAAPAALVVAIGLTRIAGEPRRHVAAVTTYAVPALLLTASGATILARASGPPFPGAAFESAAPPGCVASDDPGALIEMNRLSSDFREGCRVAIDVSGITYASLHREYPNGQTVPRRDNIAFHQYLVNYLTGARSFVIARAHADGISRPFIDDLDTHRPLAIADGLTLRAGDGSARH